MTPHNKYNYNLEKKNKSVLEDNKRLNQEYK